MIDNINPMFKEKDDTYYNKYDEKVEGNVSALFKNGDLISTRGIFRDINRRKQMEKETARIGVSISKITDFY